FSADKMQISQNNSLYPILPSCRNYDSTQAINKFNETLCNFKHSIHEIKSQVTNVKPKVNPVEHYDFTTWLDSFENFLSELENQIMKLIDDFGHDHEIDYIKLYGWINKFVKTVLEKELPPNLTNKLGYKFQNQITSNLNQTDIEIIFSSTVQQINNLKNNTENLVENPSDNIKINLYNKFAEYIKDFVNQISNIKNSKLHSLLANENQATDNNNQTKNNLKMNTSGKYISDVPTRRNTNSYAQERDHDQLIYNQRIELQIENETLKKKVQNLEQLQNVNVNLREKLKSTNSRIHNLENENKSLRKEAAKYQSALGDAKNFRISDNDPNNISHLTRDIEDLKHQLENFCSLKKVNIDYTAFKELLKKYGCSSAEENPSRILVKGILQRHVIDMVIEEANKYLKIDDENELYLETNENKKEKPLETLLISTTKKLLKYIDLFSTNRIGKDEVTQAAPAKLRQLIYAVLGIRGFSETPNKDEHPFIIELRDRVVDDLNKYRTIKGPQKNDEIKSTATELIREIISIFCFRLNVQEPIVEYKWYNNSNKIDLEFMDCSVDEDELDKIVVDICYFPLIGTNLEHVEKYQVITRASVVQTDAPGFFDNAISDFPGFFDNAISDFPGFFDNAISIFF
ncbi:20544_t:CDS:2, partial [Gigaspora rosea]